MAKILFSLPDKLITYSFYLLFFLVPLILTPFNYELFEYNKMMLTYAFSAVIVGSWLVKMILNRQIKIARTPADIPLLLFLISQIISTVFSIDRHVSIWGYYSRFNGGLLSTISYILLYYAFVTNFPKEKIKTLLFFILGSGFLVSIYGILEHLGIDKDIWVQDVQNRVFSTLGQPNWLAAYLAVLIPITSGLIISKFSFREPSGRFHFSLNFQSLKIKNLDFISNFKFQISNYIGLLVYWIIGIIFYATLIFTKSRSGFLGFWITNAIFWSILFLRFKQNIVRLLIIFNFSFLIFNFLFGAPFDQINKFTLPQLINQQSNNRTIEQSNKPTGGSVIDVGITESGTIRRIVWKGALDIFKNNPLIGSGVETFAFAYYKYRPKEHNMTSEWDFLYNKVHNEYLNFAATTGAFGLGSYLLIIFVFVGWNIKNIKYQISNIKYTNKKSKIELDNSQLTTHNLQLALFTAWLSILITNFFGFSVVIIQLFFFLIPAIFFVMNGDLKFIRILKSNIHTSNSLSQQLTVSSQQKIAVIILLSVICYLLYVLTRLWYADVIFASGYHLVRSNEYTESYKTLKKAINLNNDEPLYYDEFSLPAAQLALALYDEKDATISSQLQEEAIAASTIAVTISSNNVNFWKTRTRILFALSPFDDQYLTLALAALEKAKTLAPTDPKIRYNLSLLYDKIGKRQESITELVETTKLKPDYRDAYFALALFYEKDKQKGRAKETLQYILTKIATDDAEAKRKLEDLK